MSNKSDLVERQKAPLATRSDIGLTIRSIGYISRLRRIADNDADYHTANQSDSESNREILTAECQIREEITLCE